MADLPRSDGIEAIDGWRLWRLGLAADGHPGLLPAGSGGTDAWIPRRAAEARCGVPALIRGSRRPHEAPDLRCVCGIHASRALGDAPRDAPAYPTPPVAGTVALWGRVIEHERGWRAHFGYPSRLTLVCTLCVGLEPGPGVPVVMHRFDGQLYPLCELHRRGIELPGGRHTADAGIDPAELQGELLDVYAVDLLPFDRVEAMCARPAAPLPPAFFPRILPVTG
ncbi:MAG: hypothetical protein ACXWZU_10655 [Actinomycetota bacterium]